MNWTLTKYTYTSGMSEHFSVVHHSQRCEMWIIQQLLHFTRTHFAYFENTFYFIEMFGHPTTQDSISLIREVNIGWEKKIHAHSPFHSSLARSPNALTLMIPIAILFSRAIELCAPRHRRRPTFQLKFPLNVCCLSWARLKKGRMLIFVAAACHSVDL